jgi:hypothetical protein
MPYAVRRDRFGNLYDTIAFTPMRVLSGASAGRRPWLDVLAVSVLSAARAGLSQMIGPVLLLNHDPV